MALFGSQPVVLERLRSADLGLVIEQASSLQDVAAAAQKDRSLYLILGPYKPIGADGGSSRQWRETWVLVLALKTVGKQARIEEMRHAAAPYLNAIVERLDQWRHRPASGAPAWVGEIEFVEGPRPAIADGFAYFPLAYQVTSLTEAAGGSTG